MNFSSQTFDFRLLRGGGQKQGATEKKRKEKGEERKRQQGANLSPSWTQRCHAAAIVCGGTSDASTFVGLKERATTINAVHGRAFHDEAAKWASHTQTASGCFTDHEVGFLA